MFTDIQPISAKSTPDVLFAALAQAMQRITQLEDKLVAAESTIDSEHTRMLIEHMERDRPDDDLTQPHRWRAQCHCGQEKTDGEPIYCSRCLAFTHPMYTWRP